MGDFCFNTTRILIIFENLFVAALASLLIYVSFSAMDQDFGMDTLNDSHPKAVHGYISAISAGVGIIILLLSLLGLLGAIKKSKSVLTMYASIIFFMVLMLAFLVAITLTMRTNGVIYRDVDKNIVNSTISIYNQTDPTDVRTRVIDHIQQRLLCCGINSPNDWKDYGTRKLSKSCCLDSADSPTIPALKICEIPDFKVGCWRAMTDYFHSNLATARIILYVMIAFGLVCTLAAYLMVRTLKRSLEVV